VRQDNRRKELEIERFETAEFWEARADVLEGRRGDAMRKARAAEILKLWKERQDVLHAREDGADPVREAVGEEAASELAERPRPARLWADEDAPMYAQVRHGREEGGNSAEGGEAVAKFDRQLADGEAIDVT